MAKLSDKAYKLIEKYKNKYGERPRPWYFEQESMNEYERYLEELNNKQKYE